MPYLIRGTRRGARILSAAVALLAVGAAPAAAAGKAPVVKNAAANPLGCVASHALSNPFRAWSDTADYALAPGGDFESGATGWSLNKASLTGENQPFAIGTSGRNALRVPAGATATSAPMCIDSRYPHFRLFARNVGKLKGTMKAEVLFLTAKGDVKATASGTIVASTAAWFPSDSLKIGVVFDSTVAGGAAPVAFRFTAGKESDWRIDDLYVDPWARR